MRKPATVWLLMLAAMLACNFAGAPSAPGLPPAPSATITSQASVASPAIPTRSPTPAPPPDLSAKPLVWFGPLPPMTMNPGRPFIGSQDFMDLFTPDAPWQQAASIVNVFKLYGEWVGSNASDAQLEQVVSDLQRRGMALAIEAGPLNPPANCGQGVESFAGVAEGLRLADRIRDAGGRIDLLALDEPYYFAHVYDGPNACHWTDEQVAQGVDTYIQALKEVFPDIVVGDTEPFPPPTTPEMYRDWLLTFRRVSGYDLAFLHMDLDWSNSDWSQQALKMEDYGRSLGIPIGIIYFGNSADPDDATWVAIAGQRIVKHQIQDGGKPDQILFQSWEDHPDLVLPETDPMTFTGLIRTYATAPDQLGFRAQGPGGNLALGKAVRVSAVEPGHPGSDAVDGDTGTHWSAGDGPPQWIEIDLGATYNLAEIRLTASQFPAGRSVHRVMGKGSGTGGEFVLLHTFDGPTEDGQRLIFKPDAPWEGIQVIRIMTDVSPSWVAWHEIQVIGVGAGAGP